MSRVLRMAVGLLAATVATGTAVRVRAEGVGAEPKGGSAGDHLYAAATILSAPGGLVALGGPTLRRLPTGGRRWETLHTVPGDHSYRVAADNAGRLLAAWENERLIHLLSPATKAGFRFPSQRRLPPKCRGSSCRASSSRPAGGTR